MRFLNSQVNPWDLLDVAAQAAGTTMPFVYKSRFHDPAAARHSMMAIMEDAGWRTTAIAEFFDCDHSIISYARKKVQMPHVAALRDQIEKHYERFLQS